MTLFIPGELYKTKAEVPLYLLTGGELSSSHNKGLSYWSPGKRRLSKTTLPADIYVMCLGLNEFEDRRIYALPNSNISDTTSTLPDTPSAIHKDIMTRQKPSNKQPHKPVFELTLLYRQTAYVFVCSGYDAIKGVSDLFFEHVPTT